MISDRMKPLVAGNSVIRAMFEEGKKMAEERGAENVFDFSIGNPNVPAPEAINRAMKEILDGEDPVKVHGYMSNADECQMLADATYQKTLARGIANGAIDYLQAAGLL